MVFTWFRKAKEKIGKWWGKNYEPSNNHHFEVQDKASKYPISLENELSKLVDILLSKEDSDFSVGVYDYVEKLKQREGVSEKYKRVLDTTSGIALIKRAYEKKERNVSFKSYLKAYLLRSRAVSKNKSIDYVEVPFAYTLQGEKPKIQISYDVLEEYFGISETNLRELENKEEIKARLGQIKGRIAEKEAQKKPLYEVFAPRKRKVLVYRNGEIVFQSA